MTRRSIALIALLLIPAMSWAGDLTIRVPVPKMGSADSCGFVWSDSAGGLIRSPGVPVTTRQIIFRGEVIGNPADSMRFVVDCVGLDTVGVSIDSAAVADGHPRRVRAYASNDFGAMWLCGAPEFVFVLPAREPPPPPDTTGAGLTATYFTGTNFEMQAYAGVDSSLSLNWGVNPGWAGGPIDYWSARMSAILTVPYSGLWTLAGSSDDGHSVWIDNGLTLYTAVKGDTQAILQLSAGDHNILAEFHEGWGAARFVLSWQGPNTPAAPIPKEAFRR